MSDEKPPEGVKTEVKPDPSILEEDSKEYWKAEAKRSFVQRQGLKAELEKRDKADLEKEQARLKETQKWEEAYNKEVPTLKTELETYKNKWTSYEAKLTERVAEKEAKLSKEAKDEYDKFISKLPLEDRDDWLNAKAGIIVTSSPASGRTGVPGGTQKPVQTMDAKDRFEAYRANPQAFAKAII